MRQFLIFSENSALTLCVSGESMDADAMILILDYREVDGEEKPIFLAFKHGISEEKY